MILENKTRKEASDTTVVTIIYEDVTGRVSHTDLLRFSTVIPNAKIKTKNGILVAILLKFKGFSKFGKIKNAKV